ncbi:MAG TPA: ABC transporter ATP-binding protein [Mucilaginibacter sp.]|jgi:ATP-binding cassette subfamily B protein|nr:ABC transporter ATP-binding protein [Mucilaginibacter sp.]
MKKILKLFKEVKLRRTLHLIWSLSPGATILTLIMTVAENAMFLLIANSFKNLVNAVSKTASYTPDKIKIIETYLVEWFIIIIIYVIIHAISQYISQLQAAKVAEYIDDKIHASAVSLDLAFYESPEYFDTLKRAKDAGSERPNAVVITLIDVFKSSVMCITLSYFVISISTLLLPILIVCIIPTFLARILVAEKLHRLREAHTPVERKAAYLSSLITGDSLAKEVRGFGLGDYLKKMYLAIRLDLLTQRLKIVRSGATYDMITSILASMGFFGCITFICFSAIKGKISLGDISIFIILFPQLFNVLQSLSQNLSSLYQNSIFITHLFQLFDLKPVLDDNQNATAIPTDADLKMKVENVNFTYPNSKQPVLKNVNITVAPGKVVAIVGLNGAGKTTLIKLLCRLYDPTSGQVKLGDHDIRDFKAADFRKNVSVVFQDFGKYNLSVVDNIKFGDINGERPYDDIIKAAKSSGANEFVESFPNQYETIMGRIFEDGHEVSIGQWQKLAIARALYSPSKFIILDEATSALDALAEFEFFKIFRKSIGNRGAVVISHRVSAVKHADYIYVMSNGEVSQEGTHAELIAMKGDYATLFNDDKQVEIK